MSKRHLELVGNEVTSNFEPIKKSKKGRQLTNKEKAFRFRSCTDKKRFRTEKEARNFISHLKRNSHFVNNGLNPLRPYACTFCNGFHTSSSFDNEKAAA